MLALVTVVPNSFMLKFFLVYSKIITLRCKILALITRIFNSVVLKFFLLLQIIILMSCKFVLVTVI